MISPPLSPLRLLPLACLLAACGSGANRPAIPDPGGTGGAVEETGGAGGGNRTGGAGGAPATGGAGGAAGAVEPTPDAGEPAEIDASTPPPDAVAADTAPTGACGTSPAAPGTVLQLEASGGDPYAYFASKNLMPIDGPSSGYITDTGCSFKFV